MTLQARAGTLLFVPIVWRKALVRMVIERHISRLIIDPIAAASSPLPDVSGWMVFGLVVAFVAITAALAVWRPATFARLVLWLPFRIFYRLHISARENPNRWTRLVRVESRQLHRSRDSLHVAEATDSLFGVRAVHEDARVTVFAALARVIPIDGSSGPRALVQSLRMASEVLCAEKRCVCLRKAVSRAPGSSSLFNGVSNRSSRAAQHGRTRLSRPSLGEHFQLPRRKIPFQMAAAVS